MANRVLRHFATAFEKSDSHMLVGKLNRVAMCLTKSRAKPSASSPVVVGINCACLVSRLTITRIALNSSDHGRFTIKSIILNHTAWLV